MAEREIAQQKDPNQDGSTFSLLLQLAEAVRRDAEQLSLEQLGLPRIYGYADAQQRLKAENLIVNGQLDDPFLLNSMEIKNKKEQSVEAFLLWCKQQYNLQSLYYPMCGWHLTPREVFGSENVVHLSNDDYHPYLENLGYGMRVRAQVQNQPIKNDVFDAIFLRGWDIPKSDVETSFGDFRRVVKEDGFFIIEFGNNRNIAKHVERHLEPAIVPEEIKRNIKGWFGLYQNKEQIPKQRGIWKFKF